MSGKSSSPARLRPLKAAAVVLAILVVVPGVDVVARIASPQRVAEAIDRGIDSGVLLEDGDAFAALDRIQEAVEPDGGEVPAWFTEEVGIPPDARDVRVDAGDAVFGYVVTGQAGEVLARASERMESAGWTEVPLGEIDGATFVKSSGTCTWALVTCTGVGADTSVVVRCVVQ